MSLRSVIGFSAFLLTLFTLSAPVGAAEMNRDVVTTKDGDYFGFDLRTEQDVTQDQCELVCLADQSCKAFTYNPKVKWCFLKSDFNQLKTAPGSVAGKVVETADEPDIGAPPKLQFVSDQLAQDARQVKASLSLTDDQKAQGVDGLVAAGRAEVAKGNIENALKAFRGALAVTPDNGPLWIETARAANRAEKNTYIAGQAALAALNGYQLTRTTQSRADALAVLGDALQNSENYRASLEAYKASLALVNAKPVEAAYLDLRSRQGFRVTNHTIDADSVNPRACVQFSDPLVKMGTDYTPFVTLNGTAPKALEAKGSEICVEGLEHGQRYKLALRPGLPSAVGESS